VNGFHGKDLQAIAARIRGLLGDQDGNGLEASARRLGVSEVSLRISLDRDDPRPTIDIIAAVALHYGVDLAWLVTGEYDIDTHRQVIEDDSQATLAGLQRLAVRIMTPTGVPPVLPPDPRPLKERLERLERLERNN
jgi:hypothetical protein